MILLLFYVEDPPIGISPITFSTGESISGSTSAASDLSGGSTAADGVSSAHEAAAGIAHRSTVKLTIG